MVLPHVLAAVSGQGGLVPAYFAIHFLMAESITAEACAESVVKSLETEKFLILPHEEVAQYIVSKAENYDRWLHSLRKLRKTVLANKVG